ncbi:hypothetical protein [Vibrio vulnificus]|uniref:hypothetical protein n=1 Tax=Vibrio vulnificus TaxID=672 RepID=UPI00307E6668
MRKFAASIAVILMLSGCASNDIGQVVNDGVNGAINGVLGSVGSESVAKNDKSYSVERERIYLTDAKRTNKNYGTAIVTKTEKNPKSSTELVFESCAHPRIGGVKCEAYLYEVTPEGWLVENGIHFGSESYRDIKLAAGKYYFKVQTKGLGSSYYMTGEVNVLPFVTTFVAVTVE